MERDKENEQALRLQEWTVVLQFWGEDIKKHTGDCVRAVEEAVFERMTVSFPLEVVGNDYSF